MTVSGVVVKAVKAVTECGCGSGSGVVVVRGGMTKIVKDDLMASGGIISSQGAGQGEGGGETK